MVFTEITNIVPAGNATDAARFFLASNADEERMPPRRLRRVRHGHGTVTRRNHHAISKADPLVAVMFKDWVAYGPVGLLVLPSVDMELLSDVRLKLVGIAFHGTPRFNSVDYPA